MLRKIFISLICLILVCIIGLYFYKTANGIGKTFNNEAELLFFQKQHGYVWLGKFDVEFPGVVSSVRYSKDSISFTKHNGARHSYPGYYGYVLKVVRLTTVSGETIYVFRSENKK